MVLEGESGVWTKPHKDKMEIETQRGDMVLEEESGVWTKPHEEDDMTR